MRAAVAEWKRQRREVFVPLTYRPGDLGDVDFFEVLVDVAGERRKAWLFLLRLMYSGRDFGWIYERQDPETSSVIVVSPNASATGMMVSVRVVPLPPSARLLSATTAAAFEEAADTASDVAAQVAVMPSHHQ